MALQRDVLLILGGCLLAWLAWAVNPLTVYNASVSFPAHPAETHAVTLPFTAPGSADTAAFTVQGTVNYLPLLRSGTLRITPDDCLESLSVNGYAIEAVTATDPLTRCSPDVVTVDLSPYLSPGRNRIEAQLRDFGGAYGVDIRGRHSFLGMLLIIGGLGAALYGAYGWWTKNLLTRVRMTLRLQRWWKHLLLADLLLTVAVGARLWFFDSVPAHFADTAEPWLVHIQRHGLAAYGDAFSSGAPLYTYLLGLTDLLLSTGRMHMVRLLTFAGEAVAAYFAYHIVARLRGRTSLLAVAAPLLLLASPSVIAEGAAAQYDIWYTAFLLATVFSLMAKQPTRALLWYGIAFSFKPQALLLAPLLLACLLKRLIPWTRLWIVPAVYLASILPAWLEGRHLSDLLLIYWHQFHNYAGLGDAGNIYSLMSGAHASTIRIIGVAFGAMAALAFALANRRRWHPEEGPASMLLLAALCLALMPYLLPVMPARAFFPVDVFSLVLACLRPQWLMAAVFFQCASLFAGPGIHAVSTARAHTALILNTLALLTLVQLCWRYVWKRARAPVPLPVRMSKAA